MNFRRIDRWSLRYKIVKIFVDFAHNWIFYRKVSVIGRENLPKDTPLFFAPNHQNALMDALMILCNINTQPVFIARADIFKNKFIARILIFLKILPAYRIRDGKENLKKNEEIFDISVKILENNNTLTLFPETTHTNKRRLQILKKGVQRIVFQAEEKNDFKLGVKIIPIGMYYSNYWNFKSDVQIIFGKPIDIQEYLELYQENPQKAMLALRDKLTDEIKPLIINIENKEYYNLFEFMREVYNRKMRRKLKLKKNIYNKFIADKQIIKSMDKTFEKEPKIVEKLNEKANLYQKELKSLNIRHWVVEKNEKIFGLILKSLVMIAGTPVFLYGYINNIIPYNLPKLITRNVKDKQFLSSINFVVGLISYPLFYAIQFALVWIFCKIWWVKYLYLLSLPTSGLAAFYYHRFYVKLTAQWRFLFAKNKQYIIGVKNSIYKIMDIISKNKY